MMTSREMEKESDEDIWGRYKTSGDVDVRNHLVERYASIVKYVAGRLAVNMPPHVEFDDLVSYGTFGLLDAIEKFEPSRGFKFKTYATTRIRGAILDELRSIDWVPRSTRQKARQLQGVYSELETKLGRAATDDEVAQSMGITVEGLADLLHEVSGTAVLSLDDVWHVGADDDEVSIVETLEGDERLHPEYKLEREEVKRVLIDAIQALPQREREVIALYYYEDLTLKEIGEVLGVTESRISQLHSKSILRLKARLTKFRESLLR